MTGKTDDPPAATEMPYPEKLLSWAGHRAGGVKKPFRRETGRPAGVRVITPLMTRLRDWAERLEKGEDVPRSILLVGGPGNGKTDAVEGLVDDLDDLLNLQGNLFSAFGEEYGGKNADNPPRRVDIDLGRFVANCPEHLKVRISIVQDATEADPTRFPGKSSQALLLDELRGIANGGENGIYICCVNRGKLAEAYTEAQEQDADPKTLNLLTEITTAVTSSPQARPCWPLGGYSSIVAWPMDIDSLVEGHGGGSPAIHQILGPALDEAGWPPDCVAGEMCPFCTNRKLLSEDGALDRLAELLRAFELGSGKRWTFRDLYSLISYMLVGEEDDLVIDGTRFSPCDWAAKQIELMSSTKSSDSAKRARALHSLVGRLYWHSLFPLWPRLASSEFTGARKKIIKALHGDLSYVNDLFRYLSFPGRTRASGSIERLVNHVFCGLLDPADADPEAIISPATTSDYKVREIDEYFSLSVGQGLKIVRRRITAIERELLKRLEAADDALATEAVSSQDRLKGELLQRSIRLFAARLVKRSLGTQAGIYANRENLRYYKEALRDPKTLRQVQSQLKRLLNDHERNLFVVPLMTTFAQPPPPRRRNVNLETTVVKVLPWTTSEAERPNPQQAYLKVDGVPVPLTFDLFNALQLLGKGMHPGSLNDETFAMVDRVRARVAGSVVRDEERLLDDAVIVLEPTKEEIRFTGDEFVVEQREAIK